MSNEENKPAAPVAVDSATLVETFVGELTVQIEEKMVEIYGERKPYLLVINLQDDAENTRNTIASNLEGDGVSRIALQVLKSKKEISDAPAIIVPGSERH